MRLLTVFIYVVVFYGIAILFLTFPNYTDNEFIQVFFGTTSGIKVTIVTLLVTTFGAYVGINKHVNE
jgi:hypothetical protein